MFRMVIRAYAVMLQDICVAAWVFSYIGMATIGHQGGTSVHWLSSDRGVVDYTYVCLEYDTPSGHVTHPLTPCWTADFKRFYRFLPGDNRFKFPQISDWQFLGFAYHHSRQSVVSEYSPPPIGLVIAIPWWFATLAAGVLVWLVWKKTKPRRRGFPVEVKTSRTDAMT